MMKYNIPTIKITSFLAENIITEASTPINSQYVDEVQTLIGTMSATQYKARVESIKTILAFSNGG